LTASSDGTIPIGPSEFLGHQSDGALDRETGHRRGRRPVGRNLRPIDDDLVTDALYILDVVASPRHHRADITPDAGKGSAAVTQRRMGCDDAAVPGGAELDIDRRR